MPQLRGSQCSLHRSACLIRGLEYRQAEEEGGDMKGWGKETIMLNEVSCLALGKELTALILNLILSCMQN